MKCSFCGRTVPDGSGKIYVKVDGRIFHFCNAKCEKNWKMGRESRKLKWTETSKKFKQKP